ncbi:RluA family pseudouridine synthase [Alteribacillus persepolensis]|nr:RluA family pseudouridine synthase [Alteribacillus persepolensis]
MSWTTLKTAKFDGRLLCDGEEATVRRKLYGNETLQVELPPVSFPAAIPLYPLPLNILFEDEHLLIVNKPPGLPTLPGRQQEELSLAGAVGAYYKEQGISASFHAVSRLDKHTSGVLPIAKHPYAHQRLTAFFQHGKGEKRYLGVVCGQWEQQTGCIDAPIARNPNSIVEHCVAVHGKPAVTAYEKVKTVHGNDVTRFTLYTGRTHQIRVHTAYCGHSLVGDSLYGKASTLIERQALHADMLSFCHPVTEQRHNIYADLPQDIKQLVQEK